MMVLMVWTQDMSACTSGMVALSQREFRTCSNLCTWFNNFFMFSHEWLEGSGSSLTVLLA
jgi:hypothetical protein